MECTELFFDFSNHILIGRRPGFFATDLRYSFDHIHQYQLFNGTELETSRGFGLGRAIVGGALAGPAGAILAGLTKKNITATTTCTVAVSFDWGESITVTTAFDKAMNYMRSLDQAWKTVHKDEIPQAAQNSAEIEQLQKQIAELTDSLTSKEEPVVINASADANALIRRAFSFLEDREWRKAEAYSESALDIEPEKAEAYLVKLMIEREISSPDALAGCSSPLESSQNYQKALRYADPTLASRLKGYNTEIICRPVYAEAEKLFRKGSYHEYRKAGELYLSLKDYRDSAQKAEECTLKAEESREQDYNRLMFQYNLASKMKGREAEEKYQQLNKKFRSFGDYKDSDTYAKECLAKAKEHKKKNDSFDYGDAGRLIRTNLPANLEKAKELLAPLGSWNDADQLIIQADERLRKLEQKERRTQICKKVIIFGGLAILIAVLYFICTADKRKYTAYMEEKRYSEAYNLCMKQKDPELCRQLAEAISLDILNGNYSFESKEFVLFLGLKDYAEPVLANTADQLLQAWISEGNLEKYRMAERIYQAIGMPEYVESIEESIEESSEKSSRHKRIYGY